MRAGGAVAIALLLAGCGFQAPAPKITPPAETPPAPTSTLDAELRLSTQDIEKFLNDKTAAQIARIDDKNVRCPLGKCRLDLIATRNGPITVSVEGNRLALSLPFNLDARIKLKAPFLQTSGEGHGTGRVTASSTFAIAPDWELHSNTQGTIDLSRADLRLGPITAELSGFLGDGTEDISRPIFKEVDKQMPKWANLKKHLTKIWAKAHAPIHIGKKPETWLVLAPRHVFVATPHMEGNALVLALGVETQARVLIGAKPEVAPLPPLPSPEAMRASPQRRFHLQVPALLPYNEALDLANRELEKHPIIVGGSTRVNVTELQIIPSHDDVVVSARLCLIRNWDFIGWFDACGRGYLRGTPVFDGTTGVLRIANVSYDLGTANLLVGAWEQLAGSDFTHELEQRMVFDLSGQIAKLKEQVGTALANGSSGDLSVSGRMESFGAPELSWTKDGFIAAFTAEGTVHVGLGLNAAGP
jgi:hypothetical protein